MPESLRHLLAELHEERVRTWPAEDLEVNIRQRRELVEAFDPSAVVSVGQSLDRVDLIDVDGGVLALDALVSQGPAVLIFFRFAGCPACNIALPYYQRNLWPALSAAGVRLVAISPQVAERLGDIRTRHDLGFTVASDPDNRLARRLGITFESNSATRAYAARKGIDMPALLGTNDRELPQPAVLVIDRDRTVRFVDISPDWLVRTEAEAILAALEALAPLSV